MEAAPEFFEATGYYDAVFSPEKRLSDAKNADAAFAIDDLLDIPNDDAPDAAADTASPAAAATPAASFSSSPAAEPHFFGAGNFAGELCVPYDDLAELEWLSNFVEESFSSEDLQKLQLIQGMKARNDDVSGPNHYPARPETMATGPMLRPELSVPAKARSKRSRAAPGNWTSRLLAVAPSPAAALPAMSSSSEASAAAPAAAATAAKKAAKAAAGHRKKEGPGPDGPGVGEGRKCLHCATDKTPQWRTGPMGPKTLCNACGVRYKSGRLVPEYRPAASPTFVLTKHSNSHRKVLELRRQKEMQKAQPPPQPGAAAPPYHLHHHHHQNVVFDVSNGDDYLIHQHIGPDFRQLI